MTTAPLQLLVVTFLVVFGQCKAHKVLLVPLTMKSHILTYSGIGRELVKQGHQAVLLKHQSTQIPAQLVNSGIKFMNYTNAYKTHLFDSQNFTRFLQTIGESGLLSEIPFVIEALRRECTDILGNEKLYEALVKEKFDFVVIDNIFALQCRFALPHRLGLPYANLMVLPPLDLLSTMTQVNYITPTFPAFYEEKSTFLGRLGQVILLNTITMISDLIQPMELIHNYTKDRPITGIRDLKENVALWFVDEDPIIGYAKQLPPNVFYLGSLTGGPSGKLPQDLAKFADSAKEGLIIVSFGGSLYADFPEEQLNLLVKGLEAVKYKVIMRLKDKKLKAKNIKVVDWLPQNDLLGHPNTKLFITHCGKGSINEAVYHAVPMLGFPSQEEQTANSRRFEARGWGLNLNRNKFTSFELSQTIEKLLSNKTYKQSIRKASDIMRNRKFSGGEEAVYWIDHVIKYGSDHLKPYTSQLSWYQILMLDIISFSLIVLLLILYILKKCVTLCCRCCYRKKKGKKQKTN